jgi:hypothetical protein
MEKRCVFLFWLVVLLQQNISYHSLDMGKKHKLFQGTSWRPLSHGAITTGPSNINVGLPLF